jgi:L-rhamnose mutarotase
LSPFHAENYFPTTSQAGSGSELFLYLLVPDFQALLKALAGNEVDRRWQEAMVPLLERGSIPPPGREVLAMMEEVFYLSRD